MSDKIQTENIYTQGLSVDAMRKACIHYGHKKRFCHPDMMPYISSIKNDMTFIDLQQSLFLMRRACDALGRVVENGGKVLFVGTKFLKKYKGLDLIKDYALKCDSYYVNKRWLGGTLTNLGSIRQSCDEFEHLTYQTSQGIVPRLKKQQALQNKRVVSLEARVGGIVKMTEIPNMVIIFDQKYEEVAVREAHAMRIPIIGILDTNNSTANITYPIPSNDDAISCLEFHLSALSNVINIARKKQLSMQSEQPQEVHEEYQGEEEQNQTKEA